MMAKKFVLLGGFILLSTLLFSQKTTIYTDANRAFKEGLDFYDDGLFAQAQKKFRAVTTMLRPVNESRAKMLTDRAELNYIKCAVRLDQIDGEKNLINFIRSKKPDPIYEEALYEIATYYFNAREYRKANEYFDQVPTLGMKNNERSEIKFKMGYGYFAQKEFANAKRAFSEIKDLQGDYYHPTNYYLGLCYFFDGDYDPAIRHLRIAESSTEYSDEIPYYLTQIFFAQRRFDELIAYAEPKLNLRGLDNKKEMYQLVGQSYFEKRNYPQALTYLDYYAQRTKKLREEEFYQLGFAQYQVGQYEAAVESFKELSDVNSLLGQNAMFYLADSYLKLGQKRNALTPLATAKRMEFDPQIQEDAIFNHAKLAYELNQPKMAIADLQLIRPESRYYIEAQELMSEIFLSYRDYQQALDILDNIPNKTPQLLETYQRVALYRGIQLLQDGQPGVAQAYFEKSLEYPFDGKAKAIAIYWLGEIAHQEKQYDASIQLVNQFLTLAQTQRNLPDESSVFTANYVQGYNYFKKENYTAAQQYFSFVVDGIKRNQTFIRNPKISNQILGDATMRAGDCLFKRNQYQAAVQFYDDAILNRYTGYDYAIFQKAIIEGLRGRTTEKILALERIPKEFPKSEFSDDALLALGSTYQEMGRLNDAAGPLQRLVSEYRKSSPLINQAFMKLGLISYNGGNFNSAISYYKQILDNNPEPTETTQALAALREIYVDDLGRPEDYFALLRTTGYTVDNFDRDSLNYEAAMGRFASGDFQRAIGSFTNYIQNFPTGWYLLDAYYHRGESHSFTRQYDEALLDYEFVIDKGPSRFYLEALEKAALIAYNHSQNFQKSYNYYSLLEVAATEPELVFEAQLGALRSAYRTENTQAVYNLSSKVANNPSATVEQRAAANFYLGKLAFDQGDLDNAFRAFTQVTQAKVNNEQAAEARYLTAEIHYRKGQLEQAKQITLNANQESSAYPLWVAKSVLLLGTILYDQNDLYNARAALEALIENYNKDQDIVNQARIKLNQVNLKIEQNSRLNRNMDSGTMNFNNNNGN